jgi:hypothetical protein
MSNKNRQEGEGNLKLITGLAGSWNSFHVSHNPKLGNCMWAFNYIDLMGAHFSYHRLQLQWVKGHGRIDQAFRQRERVRNTLGLVFCFDNVTAVCRNQNGQAILITLITAPTEKFEAQGESWLHLVGTLMSQHFRWNLGKRTRSNQHHTGSTACCRGRSCFLVDCKLKTQT